MIATNDTGNPARRVRIHTKGAPLAKSSNADTKAVIVTTRAGVLSKSAFIFAERYRSAALTGSEGGVESGAVMGGKGRMASVGSSDLLALFFIRAQKVESRLDRLSSQNENKILRETILRCAADHEVATKLGRQAMEEQQKLFLFGIRQRLELEIHSQIPVG